MRATVVVLSVALAATTACAPALHRVDGAVPLDGRSVMIEVSNDYWTSVTVFITRGGLRRRLGEVNTNETGQFVVGLSLIDAPGARLRAEPRDMSEGYESETVIARAEQRVVFRIAPMIAASARIW